MSDKYFILINDDQLGPYSKEDLSGLLSDGVITRLTPLKINGRDSWFTVGEVVPEHGPSGSRPVPPSPPRQSPKPPATDPEAVLVHVSRDGQQFGPYKMSDVRGYLMTGDLRPDDLAWHDGLSEWMTLRALTSGTQKTSLMNPSATGALAGKNQGSSEAPQAAPTSGLRALATLGGVLCYIFAVIDFAGMFFRYDLTGVSWSPIVAGLIGSALVQCGEAK